MPDKVAVEQQSASNHPLSYHLDRLNAWLADLWAANSLTLHMSDGTVRTGQFGVLRDIRDDVMVLRRALSLPGEAGGDGQGALAERQIAAMDFPEHKRDDPAFLRACLMHGKRAVDALTRENAALRADKERLERELQHKIEDPLGWMTPTEDQIEQAASRIEARDREAAELLRCIPGIRRMAAEWRGIAAAMGYEIDAHQDVQPKGKWLLSRIAMYRKRVAAEENSSEAAERRLAEQGQGEAVAWEFELARARTNSGEWCNWGKAQLSYEEPCVPEGSIRNLRPLYATPSPEPDAELVDRQTVMLNGQYVELTGLALEVMRAMTKAEHQAVKDAFRRGYQGALGFARGVCDEHNADLDHVKSRIDRARHRKQGEAEMERIAANIVTAIFDDLRGRRFLKWLFSEQPTLIGRLEGDELHSLDADVQREIITAWGGIIVAALRAALEASDEQ